MNSKNIFAFASGIALSSVLVVSWSLHGEPTTTSSYPGLVSTNSDVIATSSNVTSTTTTYGTTNATNNTSATISSLVPMDQATVDKALANWNTKSQDLARTLINKYGQPQEATPMRLVWYNNGPWKRTELINEEVSHNFPKPHSDVLLQVVNYRVPADKADDLVQFDGSIIVDRTKGELGVRCDSEESNFVALNLANDILMGKKTVNDARRFLSETVVDAKHPEYQKSFLFDVKAVNQGDPDREPASRASLK
jgi:hypothetical protein